MGKYTITDTPSGFKTLVYNGTREVRIHSAYDPVKDAERSIGIFRKGRANLIIICGLGLGYHALLLRQKFPDCLIVAVEKDIEVIDIVRIHYPENIENIALVSSGPDLSSVFEAIDISSIRGVSVFYHRPSYQLDNAYYDSIIKDIKEYISSKISDLLTRFEFEEKWVKNILKNAHKIFSSCPVQNLFGQFKGIPGVIVSAGPSLKKNVRLLNQISDRAVIVCVDTALKVLLKNDVIPHIVMTLDSQKYSIKHFLGSCSFPVLLADIVSYPGVMELYNGKIILSTTSKYYTDSGGKLKRETTPFWDWLEEYTGPLGDIQSGGSVATSVFDLLLNMGCSEIILIGQDLAYTGREIHCTGTYHNDEWLPRTSRFINLESINQNIIRKRKIKYIEAYGGNKKIITDFVLDLYRNWFEDSSARIKIPVINATEGGARLKNTSESTLKEIAGRLKKTDKIPGEILNRLLQKKLNKNPEALYKAVLSGIDGLITLKNLSENELKKDHPSGEKIQAAVNNYKLLKMINPFLRKTSVYLSRHQLDEDKSSRLIITDIAAASNSLLNMLELTKKNIEKVR